MALPAAQKEIVSEIQRLHSRREPLNIPAIKRNHPQLIEKVYGQKSGVKSKHLTFDYRWKPRLLPAKDEARDNSNDKGENDLNRCNHGTGHGWLTRYHDQTASTSLRTSG